MLQVSAKRRAVNSDNRRIAGLEKSSKRGGKFYQSGWGQDLFAPFAKGYRLFNDAEPSPGPVLIIGKKKIQGEGNQPGSNPEREESKTMKQTKRSTYATLGQYF